MTRFLSLSLLGLFLALHPVEGQYWQPSISPAPTETGIPSPSPSEYPTVSPAPTITSKPTVTASLAPTKTAVPTESPTESPAPSPSPSEFPTNVPSASPSMVPSSRPSFNPSSIPSDLPSLAPSKTPSSSPSAQPSSTPTLSQEPSSAPTDFPTISSKKHTASVEYILEDVPGKMPDPQLVTFTTVTKEIIQSALQTPDGVTIEILYVQVMEQEFYVTEKDDADRRKLKKKGLLEISMEVAAAITPGDFDGFPRMLQELILDSTTDTQIDTALQKNEQFFDFEPLSVSSQSDEDAADKKRFSNGAMIGLATSCVVGVGLFFYQARRTNRRVTTRRIKAASFTDESDEEENHHRKAQNDDSSSHGDDPSGAFGGKSSYVPKDWDSYVPKEWDSSSPQSTGGETKFTAFSTNAVLNGNSNSSNKSSSVFAKAKKILCATNNALASNLSILNDLENQDDNRSIEIAETSSDLVATGCDACQPVTQNHPRGMQMGSNTAAITMAGNLVLPQVMEESSAYGGSSDYMDDYGDEMTAIETILE